MLDVEKGRVKLASHLKMVGPVDVVIYATLTEPFGSNDGTSIEFNMNVTRVILGDGLSLAELRSDPTPTLSPTTPGKDRV